MSESDPVPHTPSSNTFPPGGCGQCGRPKRHHPSREAWHHDHAFVPPTDAQILARMKARRAERHANTVYRYGPHDVARAITVLTGVHDAALGARITARHNGDILTVILHPDSGAPAEMFTASITRAGQRARRRINGKKRAHGTYARYVAGCRCDECRAAARAYANRRNRLRAEGRWEGWVDATGTRRRLRALIAVGWWQNLLASRLDVGQGVLSKLLEVDRVQVATAARIRAVYGVLRDQPPPEKTARDLTSARKARERAAAEGWWTPAQWDEADIDAVEDPSADTATSLPHPLAIASGEGATARSNAPRGRRIA